MKTSVQVMQYYPERIHPQDWKKIIAIASTTDHMIRLVEDLLLLAQMDRIDIAEITQWSDLSLTKILADLLELFQSPAREKNITLQADILAEVKIKGDRSQITRLFRNLLDNALQYTPSGGIVTLQVKRHEHNVIVSIEDTGIGIAPENISFIFDRFWRADKARSRRYGGMGMGLAIAKAIAEAHRGEISVISKPAIGTAFKVKLPLS
jgi:signal transduction histidine kinase